MIQLANDPNAGRTGFRAHGDDAGKTESLDARRSRSGHAWPFPSRYMARPARQDNPKPVASDSGSAARRSILSSSPVRITRW